MAEGFDAEAAIRAIARYGLPDVEPVEPFEVPREEWLEFFGRLCHEKLVGVAVGAIESGVVGLSQPLREELLERQREDMLRVLALECALLELADELDRAAIEFIVLKGPALAHTVYPYPSWRPFIDIDLLVRTRDWRRTLALFASLGLKRRLPEPRPGFDERFGKGACHRTPDGKEIDLHRTLALGPFGLWIDPDELFERTTTFPLGGSKLRRLDDTGLLTHACVHAALGEKDAQLLQLRDVTQASTRGEPDWMLVADWAARWRIRVVLLHAFEAASEVLGTPWPVLAGPALAAEPTRSDRRLLAAYTGGRRRGGIELSTLGAIPGVRRKAAYAWALLFPGREFLGVRAQQGGRGTHVGRLSVPARWLVHSLHPRTRRLT